LQTLQPKAQKWKILVYECEKELPIFFNSGLEHQVAKIVAACWTLYFLLSGFCGELQEGGCEHLLIQPGRSRHFTAFHKEIFWAAFLFRPVGTQHYLFHR
jgi:hypothetical protein